MQLLQQRARIDAEAFDQLVTADPIQGQRIRLTAGAIEREHQLAAQPLAERMVADERFEIGNQPGVAADRELGFGALLDQREA